MSDENGELERLLTKLRSVNPEKRQTDRWSGAVRGELRKGRVVWITQMAAVLATGFLLGVLSSGHLFQKNPEPVATVQYIFSNSE